MFVGYGHDSLVIVLGLNYSLLFSGWPGLKIYSCFFSWILIGCLWPGLTLLDVSRVITGRLWPNYAFLIVRWIWIARINCCRWPVFFSAIIKNHKTVNFFDAIDGHWSDNLRWLHPRPKLLGLKRNAIFFIIAFVTALRHPVTRHVIELWLYIVWTVWFLYDNQYINSSVVEYSYLTLSVCFSRKCSDRVTLCALLQ